MNGAAFSWLAAAPIAHRGLHDRERGSIENSFTAAAEARARGFAIECDVQRSADGEALVFHDFELRRLTGRSGRVSDLNSRDAASLVLAGSRDIIPTLSAFLDQVAGAVPVICEIKSRFDGDVRLAERVLAVAHGYDGPLAFKSFDPDVILYLRASGTERPLGIVSEASFADPEWAMLSPARRGALASLAHFGDTRPDFLSFAVDDLPHAAAALCRSPLGLPVMVWTVRGPDQRHKAAAFADQIVFEGFLP